MTTVRSSREQWTDLGRLLVCLESCVESAARLDAYRGASRRADRASGALDARLAALADRLDQEIDRVTAERMLSELRAKQALARARADAC